MTTAKPTMGLELEAMADRVLYDEQFSSMYADIVSEPTTAHNLKIIRQMVERAFHVVGFVNQDELLASLKELCDGVYPMDEGRAAVYQRARKLLASEV